MPYQLTSPKQCQGAVYESLACTFLQQQGLTLVAKNWHVARVGELDLVMQSHPKTQPTLVFVEVRQRAQSGFGSAAGSITLAKQRKLIKTAEYFLMQHPQFELYACRFDVVTFDNHSTAPNWIQAAFLL